jgi:hypothetical protein
MSIPQLGQLTLIKAKMLRIKFEINYQQIKMTMMNTGLE